MLFLQLSDIVVLPYKETRESSSASVRFALGSGRPVITTKSPIFTDVSDCLMQVESNRPDDIAIAVRTVLTNSSMAEDLALKATKLAESTSWKNVAKQYAELLLNQQGDYDRPARAPYPHSPDSNDRRLVERTRANNLATQDGRCI